MSAKVRVSINTEVELFPADIAAAFWQMTGDEQAAFFNNLAALAGSKLCFQMQFVTDSRGLNAFGREAMRTIGDYAAEGGGT